MTDPQIRNAFVVAPNGDVEERAMPAHITPLVSSLENLRNELKNRKENPHA